MNPILATIEQRRRRAGYSTDTLGDAAGRFWRDGGASKYDIVGRSAL